MRKLTEYPILSLAERDRRWQAVRALMREQKLDVIVVPNNTGHSTDFQANARYLSHVGGGSDADHADRHDAQASDERGSAADLVGNATEQHRAEGHADQFHRKYDAEAAGGDTPFGSDAGGGESDRQHIESVHGVEEYGQRDDDVLDRCHLLQVDKLAWIFGCSHSWFSLLN